MNEALASRDPSRHTARMSRRSDHPVPNRPFDLRHERGPFDIIGDVHGCADELLTLLAKLGHRVEINGDGSVTIEPHAEGRRVVFVGDLVDRGPRTPDVLRIAMAFVERGLGFCVPGNHDVKFWRWLSGHHNVKLTHGLDRSVAQMEPQPEAFKDRVRDFIAGLPDYVFLDEGRLVVAHAGILERMIGRTDNEVRHFCVYGDTDGKVDASGLVIRYNWAAGYKGAPTVVYGHIPVADATWVNNSACIDTGCCFGYKLTALRWPERETVSVPAQTAYYRSARTLGLPPPRP